MSRDGHVSEEGGYGSSREVEEETRLMLMLLVPSSDGSAGKQEAQLRPAQTSCVLQATINTTLARLSVADAAHGQASLVHL